MAHTAELAHLHESDDHVSDGSLTPLLSCLSCSPVSLAPCSISTKDNLSSNSPVSCLYFASTSLA